MREEVQAQCQLTHSRLKKKKTHKNNTLLMFMSLQFVEADVFQVDASPVNFCRGDGFMGFCLSLRVNCVDSVCSNQLAITCLL